MRVSVLERLLVPERLPRRASVDGDFPAPVVHDRFVELSDGPFVVTNKSGGFVQTRRRPDGTVWSMFFETPLGKESPLLRTLYGALWRASASNEWKNRCSSLGEATALMRSFGQEPRCLTVPVSLLKEVCGTEFTETDAEKLMLGQGYITKVGELYVLAGDLVDGQALLTAAPKVLGVYTRADQHLSLMLFRVDRAVVLVGKAEEPRQHGVA